MSGLCPYCRRSRTKIIKYRTLDYDPYNRRLGDTYLVEKSVKFCCISSFIIKNINLCLKKLKNLNVYFVRK